MNISITPWVKQNLVDVRVGIDYRSSLGKDDFISMEKDQEDTITNKREFNIINQEKNWIRKNKYQESYIIKEQ